MLSNFTYLKNYAITFLKGFKLGLIGLQAYYYYPRLMLFPCMYGILIALLFIAVITLITLQYITGLIVIFSSIQFVAFVVMVIFAAFSYVLLNIALCYAVAAYCEHKKLSCRTALYMGVTKWPVAVLWLFIICLASIANNEGSISTILIIALQMLWSLITLLVYPIIAFEDSSLLSALKRSIRITWKNLGAMLGIALSLGLLNYCILSMGFELSPYVISSLNQVTGNNGLQFLALIAGVACFLFLLFGTIAFIFMAETIVSVIIYRRIHNQSMGVFELS